MKSKTYKVVFEIEIEAETPLEAAKEVQDWIHNPNDNWQYYVQNEETKEINSVDLDEDDSCAVIPAPKYKPLIEN